MPLTDRSKAKESGFAQVREALLKFKGKVETAEFGQWGGRLIDEDTGKPVPPREFLEVNNTGVEVLEVSEELSMEIDEWNFRVNCSDFSGSFWVEKFLESADKFKLLIPDGLAGKTITWEKITLEATDKDGERKPKFDSTNFVVVAVEESAVPTKPTPKVSPKVASPAKVTPIATSGSELEEVTSEQAADVADPMAAALKLAVGKTEAKFRTAIGLAPEFANSPLLSLAKGGLLTLALVNEGKLVLDDKQVYQLSG